MKGAFAVSRDFVDHMIFSLTVSKKPIKTVISNSECALPVSTCLLVQFVFGNRKNGAGKQKSLSSKAIMLPI